MNTRIALALCAAVAFPGCACGQVGSEDEARVAYLGVDDVVTKALALGFAGFNAADSANIPAQADAGNVSGTIDVSGQVDQGSSDNKGMRLDVALAEYSDGTIDDPETEDEEELEIQYATNDGAPLALEMQLKDFPDGTFDGTLVGTVVMTGDIEGELDLNVGFSGTTEDADGETARTEGSTDVTGTAENANGSFEIDATI